MVALIVAALFASQAQPLEVLQGLIRGSLGTPNAISGTLKETTPLLLAGIAVFLALKAGLFNIGVEGQFTVGACACAVVALNIPGVGGMIFGIVAAIVAGGAWAFPAAWIKAYRGGHEVITTIMLNNVAVFLTMALVAGPIKDPTQEGTTTANLAESSFLPHLYSQGPWTFSSALAIGLLGAIWLARWLKRSVSGYELRAVGANPSAAETAGVDAKSVILRALVASGAIGGFAGAVQVLAFEHRFYGNFSPGYGFDALGVALLAGGSAYGLIPSALLFGILAKGGTAIQVFGVPKGITTVVLGALIVIAAAVRYRRTKAVES
jgi:general nucleoside transport system permease protein